jgi:hypothetical protein
MPKSLEKAITDARRAIVLVALLALVAGCAGPVASSDNPAPSAAPSSSAGPAPSSTPSLQASASPSASPTPAPSGLSLCATGSTPCPLPAGTYSTAPFVQPFLVTIAGGWINDRAWPHGGELASSSGKAYLQWGSGFISGTGPSGKNVAIGPTADAVLAYMQSFEGFAMTASAPVTIGELTGRSVDISTKGTLAKGFLRIPEDQYNLAPGEKVRFMVFDVSGAAVVIMVDVPTEKDFGAEIKAMQPVLDSIIWQ